jgi:aminoglycoside 6'-N-acetyltransferase
LVVSGYGLPMVELRPMRVEDVGLLARWDEDPDVAAALGGRSEDWYDWPAELARDVPWRELLIAEEHGRPIGFVQLIDAVEEESHYWGDVDPGTWALDIWVGSPNDRGRGLGTQVMRAAVARVFEHDGATAVVIDPQVTNRRAIEFYRRLGFESVGVRDFDGDHCLVMHVMRERATPDFTLEQIHDIHVRLGTMEQFPAYVRALNAIGVEQYESFLTDGHSEYFGRALTTVRSEPVHDPLEVSDVSDREAVVDHLRLHEAGKSSYIELSTGLADSGVEKWTVDTSAMTLTFVDKRGTALVVQAIDS